MKGDEGGNLLRVSPVPERLQNPIQRPTGGSARSMQIRICGASGPAGGQEAIGVSALCGNRAGSHKKLENEVCTQNFEREKTVNNF